MSASVKRDIFALTVINKNVHLCHMHLLFIICVALLGEKQKSVLVFQHDTDFRLQITVVIAADWKPILWMRLKEVNFFVHRISFVDVRERP